MKAKKSKQLDQDLEFYVSESEEEQLDSEEEDYRTFLKHNTHEDKEYKRLMAEAPSDEDFDSDMDEDPFKNKGM